MRKIALFTTAATLIIGAATAAQADSWGKACTSAPESQWLSVEVLQAKVEAQGFKVLNGR
jgi:hypothetical protein